MEETETKTEISYGSFQTQMQKGNTNYIAFPKQSVSNMSFPPYSDGQSQKTLFYITL